MRPCYVPQLPRVTAYKGHAPIHLRVFSFSCNLIDCLFQPEISRVKDKDYVVGVLVGLDYYLYHIQYLSLSVGLKNSTLLCSHQSYIIVTSTRRINRQINPKSSRIKLHLYPAFVYLCYFVFSSTEAVSTIKLVLLFSLTRKEAHRVACSPVTLGHKIDAQRQTN